MQDAVCCDLSLLLSRLRLDPGLDATGCVTLLFATCVELLVRFEHYRHYPYSLCRLCSECNSERRIACASFLRVPPCDLDVALGLPLQSAALACGSESAAVSFRLSDGVQSVLKIAFEGSSASSFPVERRFAETKRNEAPRLCHLAVASRNQLQRQFFALASGAATEGGGSGKGSSPHFQVARQELGVADAA